MDFLGVKFKVYFIGVGGAGMSALCKLLALKGVKVSGSDIVKSSVVDNLIDKYGLNFVLGHDSNLLDDADIVVYSSAINCNNLEIKRAKKLKKPIYSRSELLSIIVKSYPLSIGIAGSHGKTTTTAMLAYILNCAGVNATALIGGEDNAFSGFNFGKGKSLVFEACEYNGNLKGLDPTAAVVLNVDSDHLDYYKNIDNLKQEFFKYLDRAQYKIICLNDERLSEYNSNNRISYAVNKNADYTAKNLSSSNSAYSFKLYENGAYLGDVSLSVLGRHNVYNALAAIAVSMGVYGIEFDVVCKALASFSGVKRRIESIGVIYNKNIVADYAHHPNEIDATLQLANELWKDDYAVVFQPHTYSRTEILFNDFVNVFKDKKPLIYKTYAARENYSFLGSAERLSHKIDESWYFEGIDELMFFIKNRISVNNVLVLGAGDLYDAIKNYIKKAGKN